MTRRYARRGMHVVLWRGFLVERVFLFQLRTRVKNGLWFANAALPQPLVSIA